MDLVQGITIDKRAVKVAALLAKFFKEHGVTDFAGNKCYSPEAWEARGGGLLDVLDVHRRERLGG